MPQVKREQRRSRKQENQHKLSSSNAAESRIPLSKNPKKKKLIFVKLRGLGCKSSPVTASTPAIIRSAADWEAKGATNRIQKKRNRRNPENVPVVCCTPPGFGIASDVAPRATNPVPRLDHRKVLKPPREARRNEDDVAGESPAVMSVGIGSRANHRTAEEIIEVRTLHMASNLMTLFYYMPHGFLVNPSPCVVLFPFPFRFPFDSES